MRAVDRGRHGDDIEVGIAKARRIALVAQRRLAELCHVDLAGAIVAAAQFLDAPAVDIEADNRYAGASEGDGDGQSDIAKPDDRYFASV